MSVVVDCGVKPVSWSAAVHAVNSFIAALHLRCGLGLQSPTFSRASPLTFSHTTPSHPSDSFCLIISAFDIPTWLKNKRHTIKKKKVWRTLEMKTKKEEALLVDAILLPKIVLHNMPWHQHKNTTHTSLNSPPPPRGRACHKPRADCCTSVFNVLHFNYLQFCRANVSRTMVLLIGIL